VDVKYINPFIESVYGLFSSMLGAKAEKTALGVADGKPKPREITALIGLSGEVRGMVALVFPVPTALKIASKLLDKEIHVVDETVTDVVAECVNIVSGAAKARLNFSDTPIDLSLPSVVRGGNYEVDYPSKSLWLEVGFTSELGPFTLRVTMMTEAKERKEGKR
jgi:chemotaxis protein CheX